jgi:hypothetical protein
VGATTGDAGGVAGGVVTTFLVVGTGAGAGGATVAAGGGEVCACAKNAVHVMLNETTPTEVRRRNMGRSLA